MDVSWPVQEINRMGIRQAAAAFAGEIRIAMTSGNWYDLSAYSPPKKLDWRNDSGPLKYRMVAGNLPKSLRQSPTFPRRAFTKTED